MKLKTEPWKTKFLDLIKDDNILRVDETNFSIRFDYEFMKTLALASGLKTRKTRAMLKRTKKIITGAIEKAVLE
jgi:hypothetical protein